MPDPYAWAVRFEAEAKPMMLAGEYKPLIDYEKLSREAMLSIPTPDHYLPLLYVLATRQAGENINFSNRRFRWRVDINVECAGGLARVHRKPRNIPARGRKQISVQIRKHSRGEAAILTVEAYDRTNLVSTE